MSRLDGALKQWLVIPDTHVPYHDARAYDLMLSVAQAAQGGRGVDGICILGDFADFYSVSSHGKGAGSERLLRAEVAAVNEKLDELDALFPNADKTFIQGNHEWRLERYIDSECPELFGLVDTRRLLRLHERPRWKYVEYEPAQLVQIGRSKLYARHEPLTGGALPAHGTVMRAGCSVVYGHDHKAQMSQVVMANGDTHLGASVGWLGDAKHRAFNYVKGHHQWSLGFGLVTVDTDGTFFLDSIRIIDYRCYALDTIWVG